MRGADCDTDHCLVVAKHRKRLAVIKQASQKFDVDRFNLRKLNELEAKKGIRESLGLYELKQQKPWFDEEC